MASVIEFKNVTYQYPLTEQPAIKDVSFQIEKGKFYGVIGANGSGKTTLCTLIRGFAPSFYKGDLQGEVLINGKPTVEYGPGELSLKIGYVFQNPFNQLSGVKDTVFEEVAYGLENFGVPVNEIERRVVAIMEKTDILHLAEKNPFDLSGGQQQRVALAAILVLEPDILVIDEPTSQLDPEGTESVFKIIKTMKEEQKTIILVEHKIDLLAEYADEVIVLKDGHMLRKGENKEVLSDITLADEGILLPQMTILTKLFTQKMVERKKGRILNVASTGSYQPGPYIAVYYATKAYVLSFSEAITNELKDYGISVTTLCPGATKTEFSKRAGKADLKIAMDAKTVAMAAYDGLMRNKRLVIPGWKNKLAVAVSKLFPGNISAKAVREIQQQLTEQAKKKLE